MTTHLHWNWVNPRDLERGIKIALSACGESHVRSQVSSSPEEVTCVKCREKVAARAASQEENQMTAKSEATSIASMSGPQLVEKYNSIRERNGQSKIKKFRDLETGRRMVIKAMESSSNSGREPAAAVVSGRVENKTERTVAAKKRSDKFSRDSEIEVLESRVRSKGHTKKRWEELLRSEDKTVGNYLDNIGTSGDLTWWINQKKIRVR